MAGFLSALIRFCLRHSGAVAVLTVLALASGVQQLRQARFDVFPEFAPVTFTVQTEAAGLAAEQVETLVTRPLEALLGGTAGVASIRSESMQGLSVIRVAFAAGDPFRQRQTVIEQLAGAAAVLPPGGGVPSVSPLTSSTMDLLKVGFVSASRGPMAVRDFVQWTVRPRLLAVPGVARAAIYGGEQRELAITARAATLAASGVAIADIAGTVRELTEVRGLGFEDNGSQRLVVQTAMEAPDAAALANAVLTSRPGQMPGLASGPPLHIGDVATVDIAAAEPIGDALINGQPGVLLAMASQYGADTLGVTQAVERALAELAPLLAREQITLVPALHRPASFIESALTQLRNSLLLGALLTFVTLLLVLRHARTALISFLSIPLSLLAAVVTLRYCGISLNNMTLGGLAIAIGVVVDDAVIDVENIVRRLREGEIGASRREIILKASLEVRAPVIFATAMVMLVFMPVIALGGLQGAFFRPLALSFLLAVAASLLVALTITPALCLLLLRRKLADEPRWLLRLRQAQHGLLLKLVRHLRAALLVTAVLVLIAVGTLVVFGRELLPAFKEGHVVAQLIAPQDTGLAALRTLGQGMSRQILAIPGVRSVELQLGRAEGAEDTWGVNHAEFHIALETVSTAATAASDAPITGRIRAIVASQPGVESEVTTFLGDRIGEAIAGETASVVLTLTGSDLDALDAAAAQLAAVVRSLPQAADVRVRVPGRVPAVVVHLLPAAMALHGVRASDIDEALQAAHQGLLLGNVSTAERVTPVTLHLLGDAPANVETLRALLVRSVGGTAVPLGELARLVVEDSRAVIEHESALRRQVVTANPETSDIAAFVARAEAALAEQTLPDGVTLRISGAAEIQAAATRELGRNFAIALVLITLLLIAGLGDWRRAALVLLAAPFALIGGAMAVAATGAVLSLGSMVGFVTLFGLASRNAILLLSHIDHLVCDERLPWCLDTALRAAGERLLPVLLTAGLAALGLLPVALDAHAAGQEIAGPMAIVILGGLASSTLLGLLLLPLLAVSFLGPPRATAGR
ncbi:efflux RND transporter permease subunit [Nevskia sp.]|uniref:efflux RND transporter permease subunit n=1 Tax=Nevskia sp. TaxID=1929292 RepID=UPI0025D4FA4C|nr:efflux RND transporter permease subunit [Nevskia sp.]